MSPNEIATVLELLSETSRPVGSCSEHSRSAWGLRTSDRRFWQGEDPDHGPGPNRPAATSMRRRLERAIAA